MSITTVKNKRGTAAEWASANPILADGELGFERDTRVVKIGDGVTAWNVLQRIIAAPPSTSPVTGIQTVINVKDAPYGAKGDGSTDDTVAIQAAIDAAKVLGSSSDIAQGGAVYFPPGVYMISTPLVLPRTGTTPTNIVQLRGLLTRACRIKGTSSFPTGRSLVEWDKSTAARAWNQSIHDLTFILPSVDSTRAIHYETTVAASAATGAQLNNERLQIELVNVTVECSNQYHSETIYLEGAVWYCLFKNVASDPNQGTTINYDTLLFRFDSAYSGTPQPGVTDDQVGCGYSRFEDIYAGLRRGGFNRVIDGRLLRCEWSNSFANGARTAAAVSYNLINSAGCNFRQTGTEGQGDTQYRLTNCQSMRFEPISIGSPDQIYAAWAASTAYAVNIIRRPTNLATTNWAWKVTTAGTSGGSEPAWPASPTAGSTTVTDGSVVWTAVAPSVGNGVEIIGSKDLTFVGRMVASGSQIFSSKGVKVMTIDAASSHIQALEFEVSYATGGAGGEFTLAAAASQYFISGWKISDGSSFQLGTPPNGLIGSTQVGVANGVAGLGSDGKVPASQLPSTSGLLITDPTGMVIVDDFATGGTGSGQIGSAGWNTLAGSTNVLAGVSNHPGIVQRSTTSTIGTLAAMYLSNSISSGPIGPGDTFDITFWVRPSTLDANTQLRIGVSQSPGSATPGDSAYLERLYGDTNWFAVNRASSTQSARTDMAVAPALNTWTKLRVRRVNATTIGFTIDGGTEVTIASNAPATVLQPFVQITNQTASAQTIDIDRIDITVSGLTR